MAAKNNTMGTDFTEGPIIPMLLRFALPFLLASILNNLYSTVDMIVIGRFAGNLGTAAVTSGGKLLNVFTMVSMGLSAAGQLYIAQSVGAGRRKDTNVAIGTLFSVLLAAAVILSAGTCLLSDRIMVWMNTPQELYPSAIAYLRIASVGLPLIYGYEVISAILRGMGDSKTPLVFIAIATAVNLILDIVFVACLGMGAAGTALATVIGQGVSLAVSLCFLYRHRDRFGFDFQPESFRPDGRILKILLRLGVPMALSNGLIMVSQIVMISFVNRYGIVQISAYGIGEKVLTLANVFISSVTSCSGAMIAQNIGAGKHERVRSLVRSTLGIGLLLSTGMAALCLPFPGAVFGIFTKDTEVLLYADTFIKMSVCLFYLSAVQGAYQGVLSGTGNVKLLLLASFIDGVVLRIGLGVLFGTCFGMEVSGIFLGTILARFGPITVSAAYYYSGRWKTYQKITQRS